MLFQTTRHGKREAVNFPELRFLLRTWAGSLMEVSGPAFVWGGTYQDAFSLAPGGWPDSLKSVIMA